MRSDSAQFLADLLLHYYERKWVHEKYREDLLKCFSFQWRWDNNKSWLWIWKDILKSVPSWTRPKTWAHLTHWSLLLGLSIKFSLFAFDKRDFSPFFIVNGKAMKETRKKEILGKHHGNIFNICKIRFCPYLQFLMIVITIKAIINTKWKFLSL